MIPTPELGIVDAARLTVDQAVNPTPNMRETIYGWFRKLTLARARRVTVDFQSKETLLPFETMGVIQPLEIKRIAIKPEGTRTWDWRMIHATPDLILVTNEVIEINGVRFRVEGQGGYDQFGFVLYEIVNDYGNRPAT